MTHSRKLGLHFHSAALIVEALGTMFICLDMFQVAAKVEALGLASAGRGPAIGYEGWIWHQAPLGFALLFLGMLLAGIVLYVEHRASAFSSECPQAPKQLASPLPPEGPPP